jgi:hypothetical protein
VSFGWRASLLTTFVALTLPSCDGATSAPDPRGPVDPGSVDPCSLVTRTELKGALGAPLGKPEPEDPVQGEARDCRYGTGTAPIVNVGVRTEPIGENELEPLVEAFAEDLPLDPEVREVSDLGEESLAVILEAPEQTPISQATVFVRSRSVLVSVGLNLEGSGEEALEAASTLAAAAVDRL